MPVASTIISSIPSQSQFFKRPRIMPRLQFRDFSLSSITDISQYLCLCGSRTCDYTIGGIYMWADYFNYSYCVVNDTLLIKGVTENHRSLPAFSLPVGKMALSKAVDILDEYCAIEQMPLRFSAIPADRVADFLALRRWEIEPMEEWADYLYDISVLASLSGKKMMKKRNHVNRFISDNPSWHIEPVTIADTDTLIQKTIQWEDISPDNVTGLNELHMVAEVLRDLPQYPFVGIQLFDGKGDVAAFSLAEIIGDTAYIHIEKMNHDIAGAGEMINQQMAQYIVSLFPSVKYANREEDCGDEGLRKAKESYHPVSRLEKFNLMAI